jgi:hypothetical protein
LLAAGGVLALSLAELCLHLVPGWVPQPVLLVMHLDVLGVRRDSATLGSVLRSEVDRDFRHPEFQYRVRTVDLGLPGIGFRDDGLDGEPWAVAIGDSFTYGTGVEGQATWPELLEASCGQDVANLGVSGYSALQNLAMLRNYGLALKPALVLFSVYCNDHQDNLEFLDELQHRKRDLTRVRQAQEQGVAPGVLVNAQGGFTAGAWVGTLPDLPAPEPLRTWEVGAMPRPPDFDVMPEKGSLALRFLFRDEAGQRLILRCPLGERWLVCSVSRRNKLRVDLLEKNRVTVSSTQALQPDQWHEMVFSWDLPHSVGLWVSGQEFQRRRYWTPTRQLQMTGKLPKRPTLGDVEALAMFAQPLTTEQSQRYFRSLDATPATPTGTVFRQEGPRGWTLSLLPDGHAQWSPGEDASPTLRTSEPCRTDGLGLLSVSCHPDGKVQLFWEGEQQAEGDPGLAGTSSPEASVWIAGSAAGPDFQGLLRDAFFAADPWSPEQHERWAQGVDRERPPLRARWNQIQSGNEVTDLSGNGHLALGRGLTPAGLLGVAPPPPEGGFCFWGRSHVEVPGLQAEVVRLAPARRSYLAEIGKLLLGRPPYDAVAVEASDYWQVERVGVQLNLRSVFYGGALYQADVPANNFGEGFALTLDVVEEAAQLCREAEVALVVVFPPGKEYSYLPDALDRIDPKLRETLVPGWHWLQLDAFCRQRSIPTILLGPDFLEAAKGTEQLYFQTDAHWNPAGHALAAELLERELRTQGFLPAP